MGDLLLTHHDLVDQPKEARFCTTSSGRKPVKHLLCNRCCHLQNQQSPLIYAEASFYEYQYWMGFKGCWTYDVPTEWRQQYLKGTGKGKTNADLASNAPPAPPGPPLAHRTPVPPPPHTCAAIAAPAWPDWHDEQLRLAKEYFAFQRQEAGSSQLPASLGPPSSHQLDANPSFMELFGRQTDRIQAMEEKMLAVMQRQDILLKALERVEARLAAVGPPDVAVGVE